MSEQRCPFAIWRPGPTWKGGYVINGAMTKASKKRGEIKHSAEGRSWNGIYSVLDGPARSCFHFTVGYDRIEQHYDVDWNCWHGADADADDFVSANIDLDGIEHLGIAGDPLTPYQVDATTRLSAWLMETRGYDEATRIFNDRLRWLIAEHNETADPGHGTSCPSERIPHGIIVPRLNAKPLEEDDMMKQFLAWDLGRGRWYFVGPGGAEWVTLDATIKDLEANFGPLERKALATRVVQALGAA